MNYIDIIWGVKDQLSKRLVLVGYCIFILVNNQIFITSINVFFKSILSYDNNRYISIFLLIPVTFIFYSFSIGIMIRFLNFIINYFKK